MKLKNNAHSRTGDKGEISNISIIPYFEEDARKNRGTQLIADPPMLSPH